MSADGLLLCATGGDEFVLRAHDVRHVARLEQLRPDDAADGRAGVIRLGGYLVPVFDIRKTLGLPGRDRTARGEQHIAVTGDNGTLVGWLADRIAREPESADVRISELPAAVGGDAREWFEGVVRCADGRTRLLIDPARLNPLRSDTRPRAAIAPPPFQTSAAAPRAHAEPVALVFSTRALPGTGIDKFALSGRQVAAIMQPADPIVVPGCAPHVAGLLLWRDIVVPVVDFSRGSADRGASGRQLIARGLDATQPMIALSIDPDVVMHRPDAGDRLIADAECPRFASGVFDLNGSKVALLDVDALAGGAAA